MGGGNVLNLSELNPGRVMICGDWHGNESWGVSVIEKAYAWLPGEKDKIILQLGDFGYWSGYWGDHYLMRLSDAAQGLGVKIFFLDGNHEDHPLLAREEGEDGKVAENIWHLHRGARWKWHGRSWLALGGAVSPDRSTRIFGKTWFAEEEITYMQAALASLAPAGVMLTHDCPSGVTHAFGDYGFAPQDLARCKWHREFLQGIVNAVQPSYLFHGHLHRSYVREVQMPYGPCMVRGLDMDGSDMNACLADCVTMDILQPGDPD